MASGRNLSAEAERLENRASFILANGVTHRSSSL
ncbi:hypothetical protein [Escherichia coli]|nr:hypothetical protein [Escherichia coli]MCJ2779346.1 hypothetical protein [Escherichia coli]